MKYKKMISRSMVLLVVLIAMVVPVGSTALAAPIDYLADTNPCPAHQVMLDGGNASSGQYTCCPEGDNSDMACLFGKYINPLISVLSAAVGVVVVIAVITGGIQFSSSAGDPQRAAAARQRITNALLGLLAYILLYAFLEFLIPGGFLHG